MCLFLVLDVYLEGELIDKFHYFVFYNLIPNKLYSFELQLLNSKAITTNSLALQNNSIRFCDSQTNTTEFNTITIIKYPNPCNELLTISIADELFTKSSINFQIVSINGQVVKTGVLSYNKINTANLKSGMYFLILSKENGESLLTKFVKK